VAAHTDRYVVERDHLRIALSGISGGGLARVVGATFKGCLSVRKVLLLSKYA